MCICHTCAGLTLKSDLHRVATPALCVLRSRSGGYPREFESQGSRGSMRDDRGSFNDRNRGGDRRGFGGNFDQEERRGRFRDSPRGHYGQCLAMLCLQHVFNILSSA